MKYLMIGLTLLSSTAGYSSGAITITKLPVATMQGQVSHYVSDDSMEFKDSDVQKSEIENLKIHLKQKLRNHVEKNLNRSVHGKPICFHYTETDDDNAFAELIRCKASFY